MDNNDGAIEAEVGLDGQTLQRTQAQRSSQDARLAATVGKGGVNVEERDEEAGETSPLLSRQGNGEGADNRRPSWDNGADFAHLPPFRRPSIYWMIGPFFIVACAFGGIIAPKLNLILDLICREYIGEKSASLPGFIMAPVDFNGGSNDQCRIPEVQSRVSMFTLWGNLFAGLLSAFTSPKLGALSDRYGRKPILILTSCGTVAGEIITIFAARYPETFPVWLLLLSYALDGMTGSFILAMSISNAYATDCTPPHLRNVAFGYFHGTLFTGLALGPIIAGYIVKWSGKIVTIFYILTGVHLIFIIFIACLVPESLSKQRQQLAREKHWSDAMKHGPEWDVINSIRAINILEPLKILRPTGPGSSTALRRNLFVLAMVDTIVFGVAMGSLNVVVIYTNYRFGWETLETGKFMTIASSARVIALVAILPGLTRLVRGKIDPNKTQKNHGSDLFDLIIIRVSIIFDTLGYIGYTLANEGSVFILSGTVASIGGMASPVLQSCLTNSVPADKTGQLLGAMGLLHGLARVVAPTVFNAIYSATVGNFTQTVFVCLAATFGLAFIVSWMLRPHVYFDEAKAAQATDESSAESHESGPSENERTPITSAVTAAGASFLVAIGLMSGSS